MDRTEIAASVLVAMLPSPGSKTEKVQAAVEYTDLLLTELKEGDTSWVPEGTKKRRLSGDRQK